MPFWKRKPAPAPKPMTEDLIANRVIELLMKNGVSESNTEMLYSPYVICIWKHGDIKITLGEYGRDEFHLSSTLVIGDVTVPLSSRNNNTISNLLFAMWRAKQKQERIAADIEREAKLKQVLDSIT